ncbi:hypothetical protein F4X33_19640 [Candidatus Poribacteria bacterium]|nr:hypothetical protein [Candidatus Poribacteria bacterium]
MIQPSLDFDVLPPADRFPLNRSNQKVEQVVRADFDVSDDFLIVTGFSSLSYMVEFLGGADYSDGKRVRVVLGNEPMYTNLSRRDDFRKIPLKQEIRDFWLEEGISITQCGSILRLIEHIENDRVKVKFSDSLHAKMYVGTEHAILGSSNFSVSGLRLQNEANIRFEKSKDEYKEIRQIAEHFWKMGGDYKQEIIDLLRRLLSLVTWEEALARAIAEVLEGSWLKKYPQVFDILDNFQIWPSQVQAIGQALYILDNHGSLLIADPTGSGKTRLGAGLHLSIINRLWTSGRGVRSNTLIVCPPQVIDNWKREYQQLAYNYPVMLSQGRLSMGDQSLNRNNIKDAKILYIDEAHNYLNKRSNRSAAIQYNSADHIALFTATPINKKIEDLFRLIEILDIDNLSDEAIDEYVKLTKKRGHLGPADAELLRNHIRNFTIRRTKKDLNRLIDEAPEKYLNQFDEQCRYPEHVCGVYPIRETEGDIEIAQKINVLARKLKGLIFLRKMKLRREELRDNKKQREIMENRQKAAAALALYNVQAMMRSSRAALLEHIKGTEEAKKHFGIDRGKNLSGNMIGSLERHRESLPEHNLTIELPAWMTDLEFYQNACDREIKLYDKIADLCKRLSDHREKNKARFIAQLVHKHSLILAFDSRLLSLHYIEQILRSENKQIETLTVTGDNEQSKSRARAYFGLEGKKREVVGFCSDVMSEGVNLQRASAVILLDMPSVMRIAEQRIGRIDRMDSPHKSIEIYWPDDHPEFALKTDLKFFRTAQTVENVLGSNIDIPEELLQDPKILQDPNRNTISGKVAKRLYEEVHREKFEATFADGIQDAFQPIKDLVFGPKPLITSQTYNAIKLSEATVISNVSVVKSNTCWGFFAIKGSAQYAPRWIYIDENGEIIKDLPVVCEKLVANLEGVENLNDKIDQAQILLANFVEKIQESEIQNLPNKKRRGLELLQHLVTAYLKPRGIDRERKDLLLEIQRILKPDLANEFSIDYYQLAQTWLDIVQPILIEERQKSRRVVHLKILERKLKREPLDNGQLAQLTERLPTINNIGKRIASCIIGIVIDG